MADDDAAAILTVEAEDPPVRLSEPVRCGVPWPRGALREPLRLTACDERGGSVPFQAEILERWTDGSVRWLLVDWLATVRGRATFRFHPEDGTPPGATGAAFAHPAGGTNAPAPAGTLTPDPCVRMEERAGEIEVDTGPAVFRFRVGDRFPFAAVEVAGRPAIDPAQSGLVAEDARGRTLLVRVERVSLDVRGPLRATASVRGALLAPDRPASRLDLFGRVDLFAGSATARLAVTLRNPCPADHRGGFWDLGAPSSVLLRDVSLRHALPAIRGRGEPPAAIRFSCEPGTPFEAASGALEIYQDSSGGERWRSRVHLNRKGRVPISFRGYRVRTGSVTGGERCGLRATPVVLLERGGLSLGLAMERFWQSFPKAVEADSAALVLRLFPRQYADVHELQGGEQKTHVSWAAFAPDGVTADPLAWCRAPLVPCASPAWYAAAGAVSYLLPRADDGDTEYRTLVDAAVEGGDTFEQKREAIDEYGWRHFGDIYADHEAVSCPGLVSHYNNQYDAVAGFAYQFLRSGDRRFWRLMDDLAAHVADIDVYHADGDKSAYDHGLFWHTYHYVDADTSTHRTYPRAHAAKVGGGGPSAEHGYASGLLLHYLLTGDPLSRETVLELARWVIGMDDGRKTVFRFLARGPTGLASATGSPLYHGPGRAAANSIETLLDAHRLTRDPSYAEKAEELIRRCIHPKDDVPGLKLLDAERRWYYTVFLQAVGRYLDWKRERGELDETYAYARESLLLYARWMADHEYPYLDKPEILEHPTETWAAQDLRKAEVFDLALLHAAGETERARFRERAEFFYSHSTRTLLGMETRTLARPLVLLLSFGFRHAWFRTHPDASAPRAAGGPFDFGEPRSFVPQKVVARRRLIRIAAAAALAAVAGVGAAAAILGFGS